MPRFFIEGLNDSHFKQLSFPIPVERCRRILFEPSETEPFELVSRIAPIINNCKMDVIYDHSPLASVVDHLAVTRDSGEISDLIHEVVEIAKVLGLHTDCFGVVVLDHHRQPIMIGSALETFARNMGWRIVRLWGDRQLPLLQSAMLEMIDGTFERENFAVSIKREVDHFVFLAERTWWIAPRKTIALTIQNREVVSSGAKLIVCLKRHLVNLGLKPSTMERNDDGEWTLRARNTASDPILVYSGDKVCDALFVPKVGCLGWLEC